MRQAGCGGGARGGAAGAGPEVGGGKAGAPVRGGRRVGGGLNIAPPPAEAALPAVLSLPSCEAEEGEEEVHTDVPLSTCLSTHLFPAAKGC